MIRSFVAALLTVLFLAAPAEAQFHGQVHDPASWYDTVPQGLKLWVSRLESGTWRPVGDPVNITNCAPDAVGNRACVGNWGDFEIPHRLDGMPFEDAWYFVGVFVKDRYAGHYAQISGGGTDRIVLTLNSTGVELDPVVVLRDVGPYRQVSVRPVVSSSWGSVPVLVRVNLRASGWTAQDAPLGRGYEYGRQIFGRRTNLGNHVFNVPNGTDACVVIEIAHFYASSWVFAQWNSCTAPVGKG